MLIIGIDPGISGSICFFQDGKIIDVVEMPTMTEGKKNKKQVNGSQIFNEISVRIKNRTASNIRTIFQKSGGSLGTQGSASHNFNQLGIIKIDKQEISDEKIFELAIESGADECISHDEFHEIQCPMSDIYNVKKKLETVVTNFISTEIEWVALNNANVDKDKHESVIEFLESLEDDDDVQNVFSNANLENI